MKMPRFSCHNMSLEGYDRDVLCACRVDRRHEKSKLRHVRKCAVDSIAAAVAPPPPHPYSLRSSSYYCLVLYFVFVIQRNIWTVRDIYFFAVVCLFRVSGQQYHDRL